MHDKLKERVWKVNMGLVDAGLVVLTWGNASGVDRLAGVMAIKPSGVPYESMTADDMVVLSLTTGEVVEGTGRPSSDTPTHLHLYRSFTALAGVVHTHSDYATSFAQAGADIPCLGTTHADNFHGTIPCTRPLSEAEVASEYELNTGKVIVECFKSRKIDPAQVPGVVVASHAPFAWGSSVEKALENAIVMEYVAKMQIQSYLINPQVKPIPQFLLGKHFLRKHGPGAYYGQK